MMLPVVPQSVITTELLGGWGVGVQLYETLILLNATLWHPNGDTAELPPPQLLDDDVVVTKLFGLHWVSTYAAGFSP